MKHIRLRWSLLIACCFTLLSSYSQDVSTQGTEFWVSFMGNGYKTNDGNWVLTQVLVSGKRDCTGVIENPNTGWSQEFSVSANNITTISDLESQSYMETSENEQLLGRGLRIITTDTVSVFCTNIANVSFDASYVLPIQALADDYIIQSYDQSTYIGWSFEFEQYLTSAFLIVATEDETTVDITPSANSFSGMHPQGQEFSITLNKGEVYQFRSTYTSNHRDLSGTRVTARDCKKIAVFNGNTLTAIPNNRTSRDHVFEQAMPLQSWGKNFVVTGSFGRNDDYVKITSSADNNIILKNGEQLTTLNAGQSYIFALNSGNPSCFLESTYPSAVFLYNTSYDNYDESGDPSMVWIAPVEQRIDEITFTTFNANNVSLDNHYVNIVVRTEDVGNVYFDNEHLSPLVFSRVEGTSDYSYTRKLIEHGVHHLQCANGFNAHVYGFGHAKGYAYLVGSKATNLVASISVNDHPMLANDVYQYCIEEPVVFSADINFQNYQLLWDFGDGQTSTENPVTHIYHERRLFHPTLIINAESGGCITSTSDTLGLYVDVRQQYVVETDESCIGAYYTGNGFDSIMITHDTILSRLVPNPDYPECYDSLLLYIDAWPTFQTPISDSRCWTGQPAVYNDYGFSFEYAEPGTYMRQRDLESVNGCDSIIILTLTVADQITHEFSEHCCEAVYVWDGRNYDHSGDFVWPYVAPGGCDSIVTLHLTMGSNKFHEFDTVTCGPFEWNGETYTQSGNYTQHFDTPDGCDSTVVCHLVKSGTIHGPLETKTACNQYEWNDITYTSSGVYEQAFTTPLGCDSIAHLSLTLQHSSTPIIGYVEDSFYHHGDTLAVITNTEFFSFQYDFFVEDSLGHFDEWDSYVWHISKPSWLIEPFTKEDEPYRSYCRVYVAEHDEIPVELSCTVYNHHCEPHSITRLFHLKSSFFDTDEQTTAWHAFSVAPNPNNGLMELRFSQMTGRIDIKVYDMKGALIDQFDTYNNLDVNIMQYNLKHQQAGIYFFVATSKEGTLTRKVVVEK